MGLQDDITISMLRRMLHLNKETGELFWKARPLEMFNASSKYSRERQKMAFDSNYAGKPALNYIGEDGYRRGAIMGHSVRAHTVVYAITHGEWPEDQVDHRHMVRHRNRPNDLRAATHAQNMRNSGPKKSNKSGFRGVHWSKQCEAWVAQITINRKTRHLGLFASPEAAHAAYTAKAKELFGEFARC